MNKARRISELLVNNDHFWYNYKKEGVSHNDKERYTKIEIRI